jgi:hypothetical protein
LFDTPTHWGYIAGMLKAIEAIAVVNPFLQRGVMVLGRWFLYRLRCQHALRLLFDRLAVELAHYRFCRWVVSKLLRYDADALEADGVTVEGVLSVLVKASAEVALGWTALGLFIFFSWAVSASGQAGRAAPHTRNTVREVRQILVLDLLPTTGKVAVQVLVLLVLLPGALACALQCELLPYLPDLLTDTTRVVPRALLLLVLFCLASRLLGFCDALAAETYSAVVPDAVPAFPRLTTAEALVRNARLPWADLLRNCACIALSSVTLCLVAVMLPLHLVLVMLPGPQPMLSVEYLVPVLGAQLSWWQVCLSLSVPILLSAYVVSEEVLAFVPASIAQYLTSQTVCFPPPRPLAPLLDTTVRACGWWARAAVVTLPVFAGLGALFALLLCAPLLLGCLFLSLLPGPSSAHPLFMFAVGLPLLATLLCCARVAISKGGLLYQIAAEAAREYSRALLLGTAAAAGPGVLAGILLDAWVAWPHRQVNGVRSYTIGGCALGGIFLACAFVW